jgi:DnaJ-class molecular chaperone
MKKPIERPIERPCPACNGTGLAPTKPPARPGVRIYAQCKECGGKGRIIVD